MSQNAAKLLTPLEYAEKTKNGIAKKANNAKRVTRYSMAIALTASVITPLFILADHDADWFKFLTAGVGAVAAAMTGWLNLRKPNVRWEIYRTAQRDMEYQIDQYKYGNGDYEILEEADKTLADRISKRAHQLHYDWLPTVPRTSELTKSNS